MRDISGVGELKSALRANFGGGSDGPFIGSCSAYDSIAPHLPVKLKLIYYVNALFHMGLRHIMSSEGTVW